MVNSLFLADNRRVRISAQLWAQEGSTLLCQPAKRPSECRQPALGCGVKDAVVLNEPPPSSLEFDHQIMDVVRRFSRYLLRGPKGRFNRSGPPLHPLRVFASSLRESLPASPLSVGSRALPMQ